MDCRKLLDKELIHPNCNFKIEIKSYALDSYGNFSWDEKDNLELFSGIATQEDDVQNYYRCKMTCKLTMSADKLKKTKIGIFITAEEIGTFYMIDAQFYKYVTDDNNRECLPNGKVIEITQDGRKIITNNFKSTIKTYYYYYLPN
jgi:hypothetical protein